MKKIMAILVFPMIAISLVACGSESVLSGPSETISSVDDGVDDTGWLSEESGDTVDDSDIAGMDVGNHDSLAIGYKYPSSARCPMRYEDGVYVYEVFDEEFVCKTNIWDYTDEAKYEIDWFALLDDVGYEECYFGYELNGEKKYRSVILSAGNPAAVSVSGKGYAYYIMHSIDANPECIYTVVNSDKFFFSEEQLIVMTYAAEHVIESPEDYPLGNHLDAYKNGFVGGSGSYYLP